MICARSWIEGAKVMAKTTFDDTEVTSNNGTTRRAWTFPVLIILAISGGLQAAAASRSGVGLSNDSFVYLSTARSLTDGKGLTVSPCVSYEGGGPTVIGADRVPLTHFPPLYPAALAALRGPGHDLREVARWMNVTLFVANIAIVGFMLRARCRWPIVPVMAMFWMAVSVDLIHLHAMAWSEPLCLALGFGGLFTLGTWTERGGLSRSGLAVAAILTGLAALTRYVGIVYMGIGVVALIGTRWAPLSVRFRTALRFGGIAALPILLLSLYNATLTGSPYNRRLIFYAPRSALVFDALQTFFSWIVPRSLPFGIRIALSAGVLLVVAMLCVRLREAAAVPARGIASIGNRSPMAWILAVFIPGYLAFVIVSKTFLDYGIPIDFRLLAPVHVALIALVALTFESLVARYRLPRRFHALALGILALLLISKYVVATTFVAQAGKEGLELSKVEVSSPLLAAVRELPAGVAVYSNYSAMTSFMADRSVWPLERAANAEEAVVAYYNYTWGFGPSFRAEVEAFRDRLQPLTTLSDGGLYLLKPRSGR
jgi:hypothetical protein